MIVVLFTDGHCVYYDTFCEERIISIIISTVNICLVMKLLKTNNINMVSKFQIVQ